MQQHSQSRSPQQTQTPVESAPSSDVLATEGLAPGDAGAAFSLQETFGNAALLGMLAAERGKELSDQETCADGSEAGCWPGPSPVWADVGSSTQFGAVEDTDEWDEEESLSCLEDPAVIDGAGEIDEVAEEARRERFSEELFIQKRFVPSLTAGFFDLAYTPAYMVLDVTLKLAFDFTLPVDATRYEKFSAWWRGEDGWEEDEKERFIEGFVQATEGAWNFADAFRCVRPGWERYKAMPRVRIEVLEAGDAGAHFPVTVHKRTKNWQTEYRPHVLVEQQESGVIERHADFAEEHVKTRDMCGNVKSVELERLKQLTAEPYRFTLMDDDEVAFAPGEEARAREAADYMAHRPPSTPRFVITGLSWGEDGETSAASAKAAGMLSTLFAGSHHEMSFDWVGDQEKGTIELKVEEGQGYGTCDVPFNLVAHEVGHMLGNPDEYVGSTPDPEQVAAHQALIEAAGVPDVERDTNTTSIMSAGLDVLPAHLVPLWEGLTKMTAAYLSPSEWKI